MRALKLDKRMNKRLKTAVSDVAVRCSYFLYVYLRRQEWCTTKLLGRDSGEIINGKFSSQQFLLQIEKSPAGAGRVYGGESMDFWYALWLAYDPREAFVSALTELWSPVLYNFLDGSFQA